MKKNVQKTINTNKTRIINFLKDQKVICDTKKMVQIVDRKRYDSYFFETKYGKGSIIYDKKKKKCVYSYLNVGKLKWYIAEGFSEDDEATFECWGIMDNLNHFCHYLGVKIL